MSRPAVGDPAPDVVLAGPDGSDVRMSTLWRTRPLVAAFLRHFG